MDGLPRPCIKRRSWIAGRIHRARFARGRRQARRQSMTEPAGGASVEGGRSLNQGRATRLGSDLQAPHPRVHTGSAGALVSARRVRRNTPTIASSVTAPASETTMAPTLRASSSVVRVITMNLQCGFGFKSESVELELPLPFHLLGRCRRHRQYGSAPSPNAGFEDSPRSSHPFDFAGE